MKNKKFIQILLLVTFFACFSCKARLETNKKSLNFLVLGDWGWGNSVGQKDNATIMKKFADSTQIDFIASTGDNFLL